MYSSPSEGVGFSQVPLLWRLADPYGRKPRRGRRSKP